MEYFLYLVSSLLGILSLPKIVCTVNLLFYHFGLGIQSCTGDSGNDLKMFYGYSILNTLKCSDNI